MLGGALVPLERERLVAGRRRAAAEPVGGAGPDHRGCGAVMHAGEMTQRGARLLDEAQRQPARQPLGGGELLALGLAMAARQPVGQIEVAHPQGAPDLQLALEPPAGRMDQPVRRVQQQIHHAVVHALLAAPAHPVEQQPGVVAEVAGTAFAASTPCCRRCRRIRAVASLR